MVCIVCMDIALVVLFRIHIKIKVFPSDEVLAIEYETGLFGLGKEYQDRCENDNCMALLSIQMLVVLLIKPIPTFFLNFVWPWLKITIKQDADNEKDKKTITDIKKLNKQIVAAYIASEKTKQPFDSTINQEYTQKVILYGYILIFACSLSLGPLIVLLVNVIDVRLDAYRLLWLIRRPIGFKAQDIGACNAFIIGFTSKWSKYFLKGTLENRLIFVVAFEHVVFVIWFAIIILYPDTPQSISNKIRKDTNKIKNIISKAKSLETESKLTQTPSFEKQNTLNADMLQINYSDTVTVDETVRKKRTKIFNRLTSKINPLK
ncbi:unnamed protein product [Brachionus calyciflorus]|uniref:Anoctamin n=1 Tax=Brachionus calyciflorus TaxID=104777 RepID=A0A814AFZ8_9BILA|nr:unnamed protein product [Brachionus calyciflorus]